MGKWLVFALMFALLTACSGGKNVVADPNRLAEAPATAREWRQGIVMDDEEMSGDVLVTSPIVVAKTACLTLAPGARIFFDLPRENREPWVTVDGCLRINGEKERPVEISSLNLVERQDADVFSVQSAGEVKVSHARFSRVGWAFHIHETPSVIQNSEFSQGFGAVRFKADGLVFSGNKVSGNRLGLRFLNTKGARITGNEFTDNLSALFLREGIEEAVIEGNTFDDLEYDIKLGEGQTSNVPLGQNTFVGGGKFFDGTNSQGVGLVIVPGK